MRDVPFGKITKVHPYAWLWEPLEGDPGFMLRPMFGGKAAYIDGRIVLFFMAAGEDPWQGVCVCMERGRHAALMAEFPQLAPHEVLSKWLYLPESDDRFEIVAEKLVSLARRRDPRIGSVPKPKAKKRKRRGGKRSLPGP